MNEHTIPDSALTTITAALQEPENQFGSHITPEMAIWHCMVFISKNLRIVLNRPLNHSANLSIDEQLQSICEISALQLRTIELSSDWWKKDIGPVLSFYESYDHPAAIIPQSFGRYQVIVPSKNIKCILTESIAKKLLNNAMMFYRTLPEKKLTWRDILKFNLINISTDGVRVLLMQIIIGILGFIMPIAIGIIFSEIIPNAAQSLLWQFIIILAMNVLIVTLFNIVLMIGALRIELKTTASLQAAIWDRLIRAPLHFHRGYTSGDLANRASGIDRIQQLMTSSVLISLSSGTLSLLSLVLMLYYSIALTLGSILLIVLLTLVILLANARQLIYLRKSLMLQGKLTGLILQFINSISKIKMTHSATRAFMRWSEIFSEKNRMSYRAGKIVIALTVFGTAFSVIATITFFSLVYAFGNNLSFGNFITFNALFSQFISAFLSMVAVFSSILAIFPLYERIRPILDVLPENRQYGLNLGVLTGKIDLTNINFRYSDETPVIFKNLNITVKPGELVAFVGSSGCGKSTIFRLLLALEQPQSGKIYYSDMDLSNLSIKMIRKQTGVVLQDTVLFSGTIWENIVGYERSYDLEEVQEIIQHVGLADELNAMPMGLNTILTEQGKTLSGGQRQRLILARALLKRPKLLLLDEATSALDNVTQEKIYQYIISLGITCLVIAHRPSALRFADRIYVIDNGTVAESGTFKELFDKGGMFTQLAKRQM